MSPQKCPLTLFGRVTRGHVEDVRDSAGEGDHDDGEGDQEEQHVLHHVVHAQDDGAEVLGRDADLRRGEIAPMK